ncbi:unnamed protein product [Periconia digitata]|uniref:Apple domain-containing protein n=1 Tax=Periconia digitata TaxID=1303443 RepID=A0A9W4XLW0_9PLEO|nr:unnamed protein product [Periconia digitata]
MLFVFEYKLQPIWCQMLWLLAATHSSAQSGCEGNTSTYNKDGLVVPFKNLCGRDITAQVDFSDPTNELDWSACLDRCVGKAPLCYGFDFTPPGTASFSCWLMNSTFPEDSAVSKPYVVDAAMLDANLLSQISDDCMQLGLLGCYKKNQQLGTSTSASTTTSTPRSSESTTTFTPSSSVPTITSILSSAGGQPTTVIMTVVTTGVANTGSPAPESPKYGLSTSAKAGIGGGIGGAVLVGLIAGGIFFLKRRKRVIYDTTYDAQVDASDKIVDERGSSQRWSELPADSSQHKRVELEGSDMAAAGYQLDGMAAISELSAPFEVRQERVHELSSSSG